MKKQGYRESTISVTPQRLKHLIKIGANLIHPESINEAIAQQEWQESTKVIYVNAYARFAEMQTFDSTNHAIKQIIKKSLSFQQKQSWTN